MGNDIEIRIKVANHTQAGVASVRQTILNGLRGAATSIPVRLDNQIGDDATRIRAQIRQLKDLSPIRLAIRFDGQSRQLAAAARAMSSLDTSADRAGNSLTALVAKALAAAGALQRLAAAADDATGELNNLRSAASRAATAVGRLGDRADDTENRLFNLTTSAGHLTRQIDDLGDASRSTGGELRALRGSLGSLTVSASNAGSAFGGGSGLRGKLIAAGVAVGTTLLPTLGALAPMLTGLTVVAGGGALAFDDLKKKTKELKKPFEEWRDAAEEAVAPHTERAVKSLKGAMEDLEPTLTLGAETFGSITERAAKFVDSPVFQSSFQKNAQMGVVWVEQFATSIGDFTQAFLDFGTKSKPALDAWQELLGGLLDTGLPGMFQELEQGIGGSSQILSGLAGLLNDDLLPAVGRIAGSFTEAFGPHIHELLRLVGTGITTLSVLFEGAMEVAEPFASVTADGLRAINELLKIGGEVAASFSSAVGGALLESLLAVAGVNVTSLDDFRGFSDWVKANQADIRGALFDMAQALTSFVTIGIQQLPVLHEAFSTVVEGILTGIDVLVTGLATGFGDLPVVGDKFKEWNRDFDEFARGARSGLDDVGDGLNSLVEEAVPRLNRASLKMNVDEAKQNLASIKEQLEDPALTQDREAQLKADKKQAEAALADARADLSAFDKRQAEAKLKADSSDFWSKVRAAIGAKLPTKSARVTANTGGFWNTVRSLSGRVLGTSYINVETRRVESSVQPAFRAHGGPIRLAEGGSPGGRVAGPGTETSDSIPAMLSDGEYVIRAAAVRKYGERFMDAINSGALKTPVGFAKGGLSDSERRARNQLIDFTSLSYFSRNAGFKNNEFIGGITKADSVGDLVRVMNQMSSLIKQSSHGKAETKALRAIGADGSGNELFKLQKRLMDVGKSLDKAREKLDRLRDSADQLQGSVKSGIIGEFGMTRAATADDSKVTVNTLLSQARGDASQAQSFENALKQLKKKGVSGRIIEQIAEAGVTGGGLETAQALLGANSGQIKELNALNQSIRQSAHDSGDIAADAMYGAGIKAAEGLVKGLKKKQDDIEDQMMKIAKSMEKAIKKALGIKSPSKLMEPVGEMTFAGVEVGWDKRMAKSHTMLSGKTPAWASMLNVPRGTGGGAAMPVRGGGDGRPMVIRLQIGTNDLGEVIIDPLRKAVSTRGGLRATFGGLD